jgi:hypothetical protein
LRLGFLLHLVRNASHSPKETQAGVFGGMPLKEEGHTKAQGLDGFKQHDSVWSTLKEKNGMVVPLLYVKIIRKFIYSI